MTIELPKPIAVTPVPNVRYREFTKCGQKPLAGGQIWTYEANSTTPKITYQDPYGMTPNTNPIILDAAGEADIYLNGTYRFVVKDKNGVIQKDVSKIGSWYSGDIEDQFKSLNDALESSAQQLMQPLQDAIDTAIAGGAGEAGWTDQLVQTYQGNSQRDYNKKTIQTIDSIASLSSLPGVFTGLTVEVKSYILNNNKGGGAFIYDKNKVGINDGGMVINGWCRVSMEQSLQPEWFGCPANGIDSDNDGLDLLTAYAKENNRAIYLGDSKLKLTRKWLIDFPVVMQGNGGFGYSAASYSGDKHRGCIIKSFVKDDYAIEISPPEFRFGLNISDFTLLGDATGYGLRIHNIGWNASVTNITCDNFKGRNMSIGYIQDMHFYNLTCVRSRNTPENPALHFDADANYVYFHGCRFENANYLINTAIAWQVHFDLCHFEVGFYNRLLGDVNEYRYTEAECIRAFGRWVNFNNSTFVPIPSQVLIDLTGKSISQIPFFINLSCSLSNLKFCDMINPSDNVEKGGVKFLTSTGSRSRNKIIGGNYVALDSRAPSIVADHLEISSNCLLHFRKQDTIDFFGFAINVGSIVGCTIAKDADTIKKTNGYLQFSYIAKGFTISGNTYDLDDKIYKFFNEACNVAEECSDWHDFSGSVTLNLAEIHPQKGLRSNVAGSVILNLHEVPYGREIPVFFNAGSGTVKFVPDYLITKTANDLIAQAYTSYLFKRMGSTVNQVS